MYWVVLILLSTCLLYSRALQYEFVFDDHMLIEENRTVRSMQQVLDQIVTLKFSYRPVRTFSYALDHAIGGMDPFIFHLSNLGYHILFILVFWLVLGKILPDRRTALLSLAFFAFLPVHIDAVAYISGRRDLLSALFSMLAFLVYLNFRKSRRVWLWIPIVLCFLLAFFSKEMGIVVPLMIFIYEWTGHVAEEGPRSGWRSLWRGSWKTLRDGWWYYTVMLGSGAAFLVYQFITVPSTGKINWWGGSLLSNLLTSAKILCYDLFILLLPFSLRADYSYNSFPVSFGPSDWPGWLAVAAVAGMIAFLLFAAVRGWRMVSFWGLWFFCMLLPVVHIFPHHELLAEHYLYLAACGFSTMVAIAIRRLWRWKAGLALAAIPGLLTVSAVVASIHLPAYRNDISLCMDTLRKAPECVRANMVMASHYTAREEYRQALDHYQRIISLTPLFVKEKYSTEEMARLVATFRLGRGEAVNREIGHYINSYRRAAQLHWRLGERGQARSVLLKAMEYGVLQDLLLSDLGDLAAEEKHYEEAVDYYERSLRLYPGSYQVMSNLGAAYNFLQQYARAAEVLSRAVAGRPAYQPARLNLALALQKIPGRLREARRHLQVLLKQPMSGREREVVERLLQTIE